MDSPGSHVRLAVDPARLRGVASCVLIVPSDYIRTLHALPPFHQHIARNVYPIAHPMHDALSVTIARRVIRLLHIRIVYSKFIALVLQSPSAPPLIYRYLQRIVPRSRSQA